ncbi:hypothetical protein LMH87_003892 [Akanthomyces muscarius]|uniref:Uncharacterized protein n=1 Tax=Akanthomyces muscarius TaxID=2231603 RepID=A0A9W8Q3J3_AKAMU|nr:hypothetical protein LMH87_003892 [Akanthomyces muscarius]KAJ4145030.1 hypothetical protein LMH87_003892 [Akanthomyces muscarius]
MVKCSHERDSACIPTSHHGSTLAAGCVLELGLEQLVESGVETGQGRHAGRQAEAAVKRAAARRRVMLGT